MNKNLHIIHVCLSCAFEIIGLAAFQVAHASRMLLLGAVRHSGVTKLQGRRLVGLTRIEG